MGAQEAGIFDTVGVGISEEVGSLGGNAQRIVDSVTPRKEEV